MYISLNYKFSKEFDILCKFDCKQNRFPDKMKYITQFLLEEYPFLNLIYRKYNY